MTTLPWREVAELRLTDKLIPDMDNPHDRLQNLAKVRVAVDGGLLHVDPRPTDRPVDKREEYTVHVVPTSVVEYIRYVVPPASGTMVMR